MYLEVYDGAVAVEMIPRDEQVFRVAHHVNDLGVFFCDLKTTPAASYYSESINSVPLISQRSKALTTSTCACTCTSGTGATRCVTHDAVKISLGQVCLDD